MPPRRAAAHTVGDRQTRLANGDVVSVAVGCFGKEYAESRGARPWSTEAVRDQGTVVGRDGSFWLVRFGDGDHRFERKALSFESRPSGAEASGCSRSAPIVTQDDSDEETGGVASAQQPAVDSSDDEENGYPAVGASDHEPAAVLMVVVAVLMVRVKRHVQMQMRARVNCTNEYTQKSCDACS